MKAFIYEMPHLDCSHDEVDLFTDGWIHTKHEHEKVPAYFCL